MGRFRRLSIEEARDEFPLLNEEAKKKLKGGCRFHEFFGDGDPHTMKEVKDMLKAGKEGELWVCNEGLVKFGGEMLWLEIPQHFYTICNSHPGVPVLRDPGCYSCYIESFKLCDTHNSYFGFGN